MNRTKGFTLIELLVVIAIIGILSAVVLASLNTARAKGGDAAIKTQLADMRAQAEIVFDSISPNGYGSAPFTPGTCTGATATQLFGTTTISSMISGAINNSGTGNVYCGSIGTPATAWFVAAALKTTTDAWCVDSTGVSKQEVGKVPSAAYVAGTALCL